MNLLICLFLALFSCSAFGQIRDVPQNATSFDVVSFNIRYGTAKDGDHAWPKRKSALKGAIVSFAPQILGLQEALDFQVQEIAGVLPHHKSIGQGRLGGTKDEHCSLLIDARRFEIESSGDFWLSDTPEVVGSKGWDAALPRIATWARLKDKRSGKSLVVLNAHFDHKGSEARTQSASLIVSQLRKIAPDLPHIVMGDFNTGESSAALQSLKKAGYLDSFRTMNAEAKDVGTFHGFTGELGREKIDYILATKTLKVQRARHEAKTFEGILTSDHLAISARFAWPE